VGDPGGPVGEVGPVDEAAVMYVALDFSLDAVGVEALEDGFLELRLDVAVGRIVGQVLSLARDSLEVEELFVVAVDVDVFPMLLAGHEARGEAAIGMMFCEGDALFWIDFDTDEGEEALAVAPLEILVWGAGELSMS